MTLEELLTRGVTNIISDPQSLSKALSERTLNIYLGIDPTATKIHLGHAVSLRKLQAFAALGHHVTFLIGDFTSLIGDTSDKDTERPVLTSEQIQENFKTYRQQAEKILDFSKITVRNNSEWLSTLTFAQIVELCQHFSFGDFAGRELIKKRLSEGKRVGLHEALYPVMQGYDSYFMDTDLQIGGADQTFNMQAGRVLQKDYRNKESFVLTTDYLLGTDGRKMSKTWGNAIWLDDNSTEMYGKIMSLRDDLIVPYFTLATDVSMERVNEIEDRIKSGENPMTLKKELALTIVTELHSEVAAHDAGVHFENTVQRNEIPDDIPIVQIHHGLKIVDILTDQQFVSSKSEAKRLIEQGAVTMNETLINSIDATVTTNGVLQYGKRKFVTIEIE